MRVLVCGGRDFSDKELFHKVMSHVFGHAVGDTVNPTWLVRGDLVVIHGGARGADSIADEWATSNFLSVIEYKAEWAKFGKKAGYLRNKKMLEEGKPDLVIGFPGGKGTAMMMSIARKAGVAVYDVEKDYGYG